MRINKKEWFKQNVLWFDIDYYACHTYGNNYVILRWTKYHGYRSGFAGVEEVEKLESYFISKPCYEAFFEARRVALKHKREKRKKYVQFSYETKKQREKELKELL